MDDVLIHAENESHLESITKEVISRIIASGLKLNKEKCIFNKPKVKYLGHLVTSGGLMADPDKLNLKTPSNKLQLQRAAPPRLRRIRLEVTQYNPQVVYVKGKNIPIPDILSRDVAPEAEEEQLEVHLVLQMSKDSCQELRHHTESDSETRLLKEVILRGRPDLKENVSLELKKYWCFRDELAVYDGLVFKSNQVVVPLGLRKKMLNGIHSGHSGI
ncbi:uncharacterized protein K02A2.6-like [Uranotaenia lowii]|uniref:uncharacterized protein K02A2.6-like n=1 Tax=Uranotaenia lowii TaxID=190385 RepID=UPI0024799FFA|nr:uncharacterized protein K02A2.6-like [Uranotaenia lowii]